MNAITSGSAAKPASPRVFLGASALLFAASSAGTIAWCASMPAMDGMVMPGGWTMSMAWMRRPGQDWPGAAAAFLGMWSLMMAAMMLPSLLPMLWRYRQAVDERDGARLDRLTLTAGAAYFLVWTALGAAAFPLGAALAALEMAVPALARLAPLVAGVAVLVAGGLQFTSWKARQLDCCRGKPGRLAGDFTTAWRHGLQLGLRCCRCCAGPTAVLFAIGVMDLWTMAIVTAAITAERLAPAGRFVARAIGAVGVAGGLLLMAQAAAAVVTG